LLERTDGSDVASRPMGAHRLRVLHVSDLHVVDPEKDRHRQRRGLVLGEAWDVNLDAIARDGPIDLVCFTGDLAFSGNKAEYDRVTVFVDARLARVAVPRSRFFVVPGNHDADRTIAPAAVRALRKLDDEEKLSAWMDGGRAPPGIKSRLTRSNDAMRRRSAVRRRETYRDRLLPGGYVKLALNADESRSVDELGSALATQIEIPWQGRCEEGCSKVPCLCDTERPVLDLDKLL